LRRLDLGAGKSTALADVGGMRGGTWGADGTILFARGTAGALLRVPASGGEPVSVGTLSDGQSNHRFPIFLPDGRWFLYFALGTPETQGIYLGSLDSLQVTRLTPAGSAGAYVGDGWLAWVREGGLVAQKLDLELQRLVGEPVTVTDQLTWDELIQAPAVSVSAAGAMIYRTGGAAALELRWFDARGQALGLLGMPSESLITPRLSPNGARAAVVRAVEGNVDVWLIDSVRASRVTVDPASDQFPIWSPDGNRIAFRSNRTAAGVYNLFVTLASSVGGESPVFESPRDKVPQDWSRDGKFLLFAENNQRTGWDLWALPLEGSREPFVVLDAPSDERQVTFSPDGRWLAYYSNQSGRYEVYVRPFVVPGSKTAGPTVPQWQASTGGGVFSKWRADGRALYYESLDGQIMAVPVTVSGEQVQVGRPVAVFRPGIFAAGGDLGRGRQWDVAPDGRFLVNTVRDVASPLVVIQNWKPPAPR
jgi:Tol biopolymer transport system component